MKLVFLSTLLAAVAHGQPEPPPPGNLMKKCHDVDVVFHTVGDPKDKVKSWALMGICAEHEVWFWLRECVGNDDGQLIWRDEYVLPPLLFHQPHCVRLIAETFYHTSGAALREAVETVT